MSQLKPLPLKFGGDTRSLVAKVCESRLNYWAAYVADFSCIPIFAYLGTRHASSWPAILISALFGLLCFSLIEYAVHRWLLHDRRSVLFYLHDAHHKDPESISAFLFPMGIVVFLTVWGLLTLLHVPDAAYMMMGVSCGYFYFDTLHHVSHTTRINHLPFRWLKKRWAYHSVHHRLDQSNFGVTTPLWDYVLGTRQRQMKRRV